MDDETPEERQVLQLLAQAWNAYCLIDDSPENATAFADGIHAAQRVILRRSGTDRPGALPYFASRDRPKDAP